MWFLALELWPYLIAALGLGLATGWLSGCTTRPAAPVTGDEPAAMEPRR